MEAPTMKTLLPILVGAIVLSLPSAALSQGLEPAPTKGKVLLLDNERLLNGDIEKVGDRYRVVRKIGETWVPAERVLRLCASLEDAFAYLRERANLHDPDERLRLARWCQQNGLREQALQEVQAAVTLRPEDAFSRRLLEGMQKAAATAKPVESPTASEEQESIAPPSVELTASALGRFITKVQPILMNTCANCHATGHGGAFKLLRVFESGSLARKTTQQNLAAVLAYLDPEQPLNSKLLLKAVSAHGNDVSQAPLPGRDSAPYRALEEWVRLTVASNPQLQERNAVQPASFAEAGTRTPPSPGAKAESARQVEMTPATTAAPPTPSGSKVANDPFDPEVFNREYHPNRPTKGPKSRP
jgi:hypothetical protein